MWLLVVSKESKSISEIAKVDDGLTLLTIKVLGHIILIIFILVFIEVVDLCPLPACASSRSC